MNEFDQFVKSKLKVKNYARYTDDFLIIAEDKDYLLNLLPQLQSFLTEKLKLEIHPKKTVIKKSNQGIDFLGYVILPHHIKLRTKTKRKIPRKIKQRVVLYRQGQINEVTMLSSFASYLGVLSHADTNEMTKRLKNDFWFWLKE